MFAKLSRSFELPKAFEITNGSSCHVWELAREELASSQPKLAGVGSFHSQPPRPLPTHPAPHPPRSSQFEAYGILKTIGGLTNEELSATVPPRPVTSLSSPPRTLPTHVNPPLTPRPPQLISEAYDILKTIGGLTNEELAATFTEWNKGELQSFLVEITAIILAKKDDKGSGFIVDKIVDQTGSKGTGGLAGMGTPG